MRKLCVIAGSFFMLAMLVPPVVANDGMHGVLPSDNNSPCAMKGKVRSSGDMIAMQKGEFIKKTEVDGYAITFRIVKTKAGMTLGGTHHLMIKVEKNGVVITDLAANSKASHPNAQSESKMMMKMGDWYMAAYDLGHQGPHELTVLFKTSDGVKHFTRVKLPAK